jgi:hypothetical protein
VGSKALARTDVNKDLEAWSAIISALRMYATSLAPVPETEAQRRRAQRWANAIQYLRTLLGIFEWRYLLLPVGVREVSQPYEHGNRVVWVTTRQLHVFGVRIARWVVSQKVYTIAPEIPKVPLKRYRLRRRGVSRTHDLPSRPR